MAHQVAFSEPANENACKAINNLNEEHNDSESLKQNSEESNNAYTTRSEIKNQGIADDTSSQISETRHEGIVPSIQVAVTDSVNNEAFRHNDMEQATSNIRKIDTSTRDSLISKEQDTSGSGTKDVDPNISKESVHGNDESRLVHQLGANIPGDYENLD
ncbi:hypothetical protein DPMN_054225 [Dreissena polymorpha]|uniref:Uncharacterized protein n=1 Tax=Dreissena polymorpha TaxID=45954 RepID=A0A9D4CQA8_DREPO|nr:hypothetical protein DPMN_054225 [Dreissena polymorpha]